MAQYLLHPPAGEMPPGLRWVLARAFGPVEQSVVGPGDADVVSLAAMSGLDGRIGGRVPAGVLESEAGAERAEEFRWRYRQTAAAILLYQIVSDEVNALAGELGIPVILLKGMALALKNIVPLGFRSSSDIDLLAPPGGDRNLQDALLERGWTAMDVPRSEQHLPPVTHPTKGATVEIHRIVRGVAIGESASATLEELRSAGELEPLDGAPGQAFLPSDDVLMAHLLVHGLGQHLWSPGSYPQLRLVADIASFGWDDARWRAFLEGPYRWIEAGVPAGMVDALRQLAASLSAGTDPRALWESDDDAGRLLRHVILGVTDRDYAKSLRFQAVSGVVPASGSRVRSLMRAGFHDILWLSRGQVEILYGKPKSALGYWGWRLYRPFDVVVRAVRYGRSWLRVKRGG